MNQKQEILEFLKKGFSLTPLEALDRFGCMRLGARCWDLRRLGYDIHSELIKGENGKHYARYYLLPRKEKQQQFGYAINLCGEGVKI